MISGEDFQLQQSIGQKYIEQKSNESNKNSDDINDSDNDIKIKNSLNHLNLNDSLQIYENQINSRNNTDNNLLGSEEIFINQRKEIQKIKKKNELFNLKKESKNNSLNNNKNSINNNIINTNKSNEFIITNNNELKDNEEKKKEAPINKLGDIKIIDENIYDIESFSLNIYKYFEYSFINYDNENGEEKSKIIKFENNIWTPLNEDFPFSYEKSNLNNSYTFMELNNLALRIIKEIDYDEKGLELNLDFNLIDNSELWIFTRSFVNKNINESYFFDEKSENIDINDNFNKYTSLIKIIKDIALQRCYITFGTFYHETNENNKLYYKSFLKRQLIDYSDDIKSFQDNKYELNMTIYDLGEETIIANVFLNNKLKSEQIKGNLFLPLNKKAKILICGKGKSVQLKELNVKIVEKKRLQTSTQFEMENNALKNCECCSIS